ncbi:MAG: hypothetical protein H7146_03860 [Burkholderiaceae bacterium]|nr:hypothetical protein [Microbacteriaceae bacterium]
MSYLPPEKKDPSKITPMRKLLWLVMLGVGLYLVGSGIFGIINGGS